MSERSDELSMTSAVHNKLMQYTFSLRKLDENLGILDQSIAKLKQHHQADLKGLHNRHIKTSSSLKAQIKKAEDRHAELEPQIRE
jgi:hypothetical protein